MKARIPGRASWFGTASLSLLFVSLVGAQSGTYDRDRTTPTRTIGPGTKHARVISGRNQIDCAQIDTRTEGIRFFTTERCSGWVASDVHAHKYDG